MGMTPQAFFAAFVEPNYFDCVDNPACVRRAFNAAVSASHLVDQYFEFYKRNDPQLVKDFRTLGEFVEHVSTKTNGAFRDIRSISNAYKHLYTDTDPRRSIHASVASTGAVDSIEFAYPDSELESVAEHFESGQHGVKVVYRRKDGHCCDFLPALQVVRDYFDGLLHAAGPSPLQQT